MVILMVIVLIILKMMTKRMRVVPVSVTGTTTMSPLLTSTRWRDCVEPSLLHSWLPPMAPSRWRTSGVWSPTTREGSGSCSTRRENCMGDPTRTAPRSVVWRPEILAFYLLSIHIFLYQWKRYNNSSLNVKFSGWCVILLWCCLPRVWLVVYFLTIFYHRGWIYIYTHDTEKLQSEPDVLSKVGAHVFAEYKTTDVFTVCLSFFHCEFVPLTCTFSHWRGLIFSFQVALYCLTALTLAVNHMLAVEFTVSLCPPLFQFQSHCHFVSFTMACLVFTMAYCTV